MEEMKTYGRITKEEITGIRSRERGLGANYERLLHEIETLIDEKEALEATIRMLRARLAHWKAASHSNNFIEHTACQPSLDPNRTLDRANDKK